MTNPVMPAFRSHFGLQDGQVCHIEFRGFVWLDLVHDASPVWIRNGKRILEERSTAVDDSRDLEFFDMPESQEPNPPKCGNLKQNPIVCWSFSRS